jgi:Nucleotidyl transferase AbiEii toxin, Type IV TA system
VSGRTPQQAYLDLQRLARSQGRPTQQLFELYVHERFLARVAASRFADRLVLKGGMLLAVLDARRATRDADLLARGIGNDDASLRGVISEIARIDLSDGASFDANNIVIAVIREQAEYQGVRVTLPVGLGRAALKLRLDLSFGDPVAPHPIDYPTLLDDPGFQLLGYPIETVIAEKAETMMALGDANTRDRDYGDIYLLSEIHAVLAGPLRRTLQEVAQHRGRGVRPLGPMLETLRDARQQPWTAFRARVGLPALPERFSDVVDRVVGFIDGVDDAHDAARWRPDRGRWE